MDINKMIEKIKKDPNSDKIGMIASHLGVVRGTSRNGQQVSEIDVVFNHTAINNIIQDIMRLPGIVNVLVDVNEGQLGVGDEIMAVAIAGDIRENVFSALVKAVDMIKKDASHKREIFNNVS